MNQAVEAAKASRATRTQASFINACLRRFLRERKSLMHATHADLQACGTIRAGGYVACSKTIPRWQEILQANNIQAPMVLRINKQNHCIALPASACSYQL